MNIHSHTPLSPQSPIQVSGFIIYTLAYNHLHPPALFKPVTSKIATQSWPRLHSTAPLWKYISTIKKVRVNTVKFFLSQNTQQTSQFTLGRRALVRHAEKIQEVSSPYRWGQFSLSNPFFICYIYLISFTIPLLLILGEHLRVASKTGKLLKTSQKLTTVGNTIRQPSCLDKPPPSLSY